MNGFLLFSIMRIVLISMLAIVPRFFEISASSFSLSVSFFRRNGLGRMVLFRGSFPSNFLKKDVMSIWGSLEVFLSLGLAFFDTSEVSLPACFCKNSVIPIITPS